MVETEIEPIPVRIVGEEQEEASQFGTWIRYDLAVGDVNSYQVIPQDRKRKRAVVMVNPSATVTAFVSIGTIGQLTAGTGGRIYQGQSVTMESQTAMWIRADGANAVSVSILLETYRAE
jgi:hypothetical protein